MRELLELVGYLTLALLLLLGGVVLCHALGIVVA